MAGEFTGFPAEAIDFFVDLSAHNDRAWFQAHKDVYERAVREPMHALMAELEPRLGPAKIFRINRDLRFSRDKSPYKTYAAAAAGGYYVSLSPAGLFVGTGVYKPEAARLKRLRSAIDKDASGRKLQALVTALRRKGYRVDTHEKLARPPRGFPDDHPRVELLRMKDIFAGKTFEPAPGLGTRKALARIERVIADTAPFREWVRRHVG